MKGSRPVQSTTKRGVTYSGVGMILVFPTISALGDSVCKLDVLSEEKRYLVEYSRALSYLMKGKS